MTVKYEKAEIEIILYNIDTAFVVAGLSNGGTFQDDGGEFAEIFK